jgi:tripartite-type tricarboxylate transporter receptor subunit TctC
MALKHLAGLAVAASTLAAPLAARADDWPARPVTVVSPFSAGLSVDILARAIAGYLAQKLGGQFVVENRPGANGNIGAAAVAKAAPDGYTLFVGTVGPLVANKFMYKSMGFDSDRAFAPIVLLSSSPLILVGSPKIPVANFKEFIAYAKANPGKVNAGTVGVGSQAHITLELIKKLTGTSIVHVPYRVGTQALPDLISGELQAGFNYIPTFVPQVLDGTIRGLAVTSAMRTNYLPNVPTVAESGFPGFEANGWYALVATAGTPRAIIDKANAVVNAYLKSDGGKKQLDNMGMTPIGGTPEELKAHFERESAKWGPIIKEANISLQ